jgi:arabinose-5-phosphate isomerase
MAMDAEQRHDSNVVVLKTGMLDPLVTQARACVRQLGATIANLEIDERFAEAARLLHSVDGHIIVTGLGKSGLVGQKVAATLASTGTPSFFVHSAEALHGDLGMITAEDAVLLISYSGETAEVASLLPHLRQRSVPTVAIVGRPGSTLARGVDVALAVSTDADGGPNDLPPTSSAIATLAMGDALAVALATLGGFGEEDFARLHPAGSLGRRVMRVGDVAARQSVTVVAPDAPLRDCIVALTRGQIPLALVYDGDRLLGVISANEIDEILQAPERLDQSVACVMNPAPPVMAPDVLVGEAERRMERDGVDAVLVVDAAGEVQGVFARAKRQ